MISRLQRLRRSPIPPPPKRPNYDAKIEKWVVTHDIYPITSSRRANRCDETYKHKIAIESDSTKHKDFLNLAAL